MRTTIELSDEQRGALLALAGKRGLRGYSILVREALAQYLALPAPAAARPVEKRAKRSGLLAFFKAGARTGRRDGSSAHDDYVYRRR